MLKARLVLDDCRFALDKLTHAEGRQEYRVMFLAAITLCRAVGNVLENVDSDTTPVAKLQISAHYANLLKLKGDEKHIYWGFIWADRNTLLKEYIWNYDDGPLDILAVDDIYSVENFRFCAMKQGPFKGVDSIELLRRAIEWWDAQLCEIERRLAEAASE